MADDITAMALPPGFLDELRARVPITQIVGKHVSWDSRKSNPARGDMWACCPFHEEKSPSFHVDDRKGFFHCFGCGAKGDAIGFLRDHQNMGFMEAVAELAREAGMAMPQADPADAVRAEKARGLADWMEQAVRFFGAQLMGQGGGNARAYIAERGLSAQTVEAFELGMAPPGRQALLRHLTAMEAPVSALAEAGLIGLPEDGGQPYDRFRDRLMFPIRDSRGRCIAFGARALREGQEPKYLNSPETPLFDKSRTLFNIGPARAAAGRGGKLLVVEGYMDVIALSQAGVAHAVAPLGTALTEAQLQAIWRICPEPVLAFDGDSAGQRAAMRAIDVALPHLSAERSLRIALLPGGQDPDDLIRAGGRAAIDQVLEQAAPPIDLLWRREAEGQPLDSPERRAALDARLRKLLGRISDQELRAHYRAGFAERRSALLGTGRTQHGRGPGTHARAGFRATPAALATPSTRRSALATTGQDAASLVREREIAVVMAVLAHPALLERHADTFAEAALTQADCDALRQTILGVWCDAPDPIEALETWRATKGQQALAKLQETSHVARIVFAKRDVAMAVAERGLLDDLAHLATAALRARETAEAESALRESGEVASFHDGRLKSAAQSAERLLDGTNLDRTDDDSAVASALRDAISREIWIKKRR